MYLLRIVFSENEARGARHGGHARLFHGLTRSGLVPHVGDVLGPGADEGDAVRLAHLHERCVLREEAIAGVDGLRATGERRREEVRHVEVGLHTAER